MKKLVEIDPGTSETLRVFFDSFLVWNSPWPMTVLDPKRFPPTIGNPEEVVNYPIHLLGGNGLLQVVNRSEFQGR